VAVNRKRTVREKETWKDVVGYEGSYQVSDKGRVRSLRRVIIRSNGSPQYIHGRIIKPCAHQSYGHLFVALKIRGRKRNFYVHRLVLEAFVGPRPEGMECRHFPDREPANNKLENLSWATRKVNFSDKLIHGTDNRGEKCPTAKLTDQDVLKIRRLHASGRYTQIELSEFFGIERSSISRVVSGSRWGHLPV
jgi:hypothetical protein